MGGISWTAQWKRLPASSMNHPWQNGSNLHLTRDVVDSVSVSTISKENRRKWCKPRGNRDVLSWMFLHPIEPGLAGARAGQSRGDGARTVSTPFTTPPPPQFPIPAMCQPTHWSWHQGSWLMPGNKSGADYFPAGAVRDPQRL